jgi:colicin import membrane protein
MKLRAQEQLAAEEKKMAERKQMLWERNQETLRANENLRSLRHTIIEQERAAEAARDAEVEEIEDRKKIRKAIEVRRFEKQQLKRQQLIDAATERMNAFQSKEQEILFKQIADKEADDERKYQEKEAKRKQDWEETVKSRTEQVERKKVVVEHRRVEEAEIVARAKAAVIEGNRIEAEKVADRQAKIKALKNSQFREADERHRAKIEEKLQTIENDRLVGSLTGQDNDKFTEICRAKVLEYAEAGKPVYPLLRALEHTQPVILAAKTVKVSREKKDKQ